MIVTTVDGINAQFVAEMLHVKVIRALLQLVTPQQAIEVSKRMQLDGHPLTGDDVQAYANQFVLTFRKLANITVEKLDDEEDVTSDKAEAQPN
jgi:hypothetical protein